MKAKAWATPSLQFCLYLELPKQISALLKAKRKQQPGEEGHTRHPYQGEEVRGLWRQQSGKGVGAGAWGDFKGVAVLPWLNPGWETQGRVLLSQRKKQSLALKEPEPTVEIRS